MIDLDAIAEDKWTRADELYCSFGLLLCQDKITYQQWQSFCRVLCHYRYVLPNDRYLNPTLMDALFSIHKRTAKHLMLFVLLSGHLEAHYTEQEQSRILSLIIHQGAKNDKITRKFVV